jgi:hypothetical protein
MPVLSTPSFRQRAIVGATALVTLAGASTLASNSNAQTAAIAGPVVTAPAPQMPIDVENAYRAKMRDFIIGITQKPADLPEDKVTPCALRGSAMLDAIKEINGKSTLRPVLMEVDVDYFKRLGDYASCRTMTNSEIKKIGNDSELDLYLLLMGKGAIPGDGKVILKGNFAPRRPIPVGAVKGTGARAEVAAPSQPR